MRQNKIITTGLVALVAATVGVSASLFNAAGIDSKTVTVVAEDTFSKVTDYYSDSVINLTVRKEGSGTRSAFNDAFGLIKNVGDKKVDLTYENALVTDDYKVALSNVLTDGNAVAYISLGELDESVKAVSIDGVEPTGKNIKNGTYRVFRPFNIITPSKQSEVALDFKEFILSESGQNIIGFDYVRAIKIAQPYRGGNMSGSIVIGGSSSVSHVMEELIAAYQRLNPNVEITLEINDSSAGIQGVIEGKYDIGMASKELQEYEEEVIDSSLIAYDGIAVIVNKSNPIENLSSEEVFGIFTGEITNWESGEIVK